MRIQSNYRGVKGFVTVYNRAVKFRYLITEEAKRRLKILIHWEKHGIESTIDVYSVSRRTLFNWKGLLNKGKGKIESLNQKRREPKTKRRRLWNIRILEEIRRLREKHPNLGKEKLPPLLLDYCDAFGLPECPKSMTIGRLIKDLGGLRTFPQKVSHFGKIKKSHRQKILRKPKHYKLLYPGHTIALDTVEKQRNGKRMYILTAIDIYTRTTFAIATKSHSSKTFAHFFCLVTQLFPYEVKNVLTDNGDERSLRELQRNHSGGVC